MCVDELTVAVASMAPAMPPANRDTMAGVEAFYVHMSMAMHRRCGDRAQLTSGLIFPVPPPLCKIATGTFRQMCSMSERLGWLGTGSRGCCQRQQRQRWAGVDSSVEITSNITT